jgi:hypothetical protein
LQGGSLNWNIVIGEATWYTGEYDENGELIFERVPYSMISDRNLFADYLDNFEEADFIFERGVLTEIQNYSWYGLIAGGRGDYLESELNLGTQSPSLASLQAYGELIGIEGAYLEVSISRSNLPIQFSIIEPWQNPAHNVPEPTSLLASGLVLGGLFLKKKLPR